MPDLVVIVPSRGRPEAARELAEAFAETCTADTRLVVAVDESDPTRSDYYQILHGGDVRAGMLIWPSRSMVEALNLSASFVAVDPERLAIGFMGDDHRPRTRGWDQAYLGVLRELGTGIVFGNDLLQGERLATQCAMTADIIRAVGHMAPPTLTHLYVDNYWMAVGSGADCLRYLPDVVVEHCHPLAGKAQVDEGYLRVNDSAMYARDEAAFRAYCAAGRMGEDIAKVRAVRAARV